MVKTRIAKCWGTGAVVSLIVVGSDILGTHTPLRLTAIVFGLPLFVITAEISKGHGGNSDYVLMFVFGSVFYGGIIYVVSLLVRRIRAKKGSHVQD